LAILCLAGIASCDRAVKKRTGRIDIRLVVYHDPLNDMYNMDVVPISTLFFKSGHIIEQLEDADGQLFAHIYGDRFCTAATIEELLETPRERPLADKKKGISFASHSIEGYERRERLTDTSFNGYDYRRIAIASDSVYTLFYVHRTDTVLPFSLGIQPEREYGGILNRVDVFDKRTDTFSSLRMSVSDTIPNRIYQALNKLENDR